LIPVSYIQEWSSKAPWPDSRLVEQDLIISRALCDLFNSPALAGKIAFRGGTAINKLLCRQPMRYSEDIDLVQTQPEHIGATIDAIREALSWLGKCSRHQAGHSMHLVFKFAPEADLETTLKLKVEINTQEHESLYGIRPYPFEIDCRWRQAKTGILSYEPEELFGTKLRALLQRRKTAICSTCTRDSSNSRWTLISSLPASCITWRWKVNRSLVPSLNSGCWRSWDEV